MQQNVLNKPGIPWLLLNSLAVPSGVVIFAQKTMNKKAIEEILESEGLLERFMETLVDEINNDDETYDKKGRQLLELCLTDEHADDFFIAICGWSVDSLLSKM